jgi:hypothetical protein
VQAGGLEEGSSGAKWPTQQCDCGGGCTCSSPLNVNEASEVQNAWLDSLPKKLDIVSAFMSTGASRACTVLHSIIPEDGATSGGRPQAKCRSVCILVHR